MLATLFTSTPPPELINTASLLILSLRYLPIGSAHEICFVLFQSRLAFCRYVGRPRIS